MGEEPTSNLTVAKLKALCVLNDLSATGKKAELLTRLLEAGVDKETLGIEVFDEKTSTFQATTDEEGSPSPRWTRSRNRPSCCPLRTTIRWRTCLCPA